MSNIRPKTKGEREFLMKTSVISLMIASSAALAEWGLIVGIFVGAISVFAVSIIDLTWGIAEK